jgi:hypothetical protein
MFLFFSARQDLLIGESEEIEDEPIGYRAGVAGLDLLNANWSDDEVDAVLVEHQRQPQEQSGGSQEASEDARVDDILARLHNCSLSELSDEEVGVLQRASVRYKQRLQGPEDN